MTDGVLDELREWQSRPLDAVFPIVYIDGLVVKVRTDGMVINRCAYIGRKHVLGAWLGDGDEGFGWRSLPSCATGAWRT